LVTCKDFLREISEFLDETTDPATKKELAAHIHECPNCWVVLDTTKKTLQVFKGMDPQPIPSSMHDKLMAAVAKRAAKK
jgi:hypothetical protein